jgi:hypothetical protein
MAFGVFDDFLKGFFGADALKDYSHASKTFRTNGYEYAPRNKFLFHVFFTINTQQIPSLRSLFAGTQDQATIGLMVKNIQLPQYSISVETMNQYNRKRLAQTKIDYEPVTVEFHDDGGDLIRNMWYNYFSYYYKDPSQAYDSPNNQNGQIAQIQSPAGFSYNSRDIYDNQRYVNDWGYIGESYDQGSTSLLTGTPSGKPPFFRDIRIYGMYQKKWAEYILINPMITSWNHDTYDYAQGAGTMANRMTIRYETVKYYSGAVGGVRPDTNVVGFADPAYYDTVPSALNRPGSTQSVLGQGGLLDAGIGIVEDLQSGGVAGLIGAVQKAGTAYYTFKDKNIRSIVNQEVIDTAKTVARTALPGAVRAAIGSTNPTINPATGQATANRGALDGIFFPTPPRGTNTPPFNPGRF